MQRYFAALGVLLLLGAAGAASATTATIDFNDTKNSTANTQLLSSAPNGKTTTMTIDGHNAVQTGGTTDNQFLYVALPKDMFKDSKAVWVVVEYYDQGTDTFAIHYTDNTGADTPVTSNGTTALITKHDTKKWPTYSAVLPNFGFTGAGPGGADVWIDDQADGPEIIDKIVVTDEDPALTHFPQVDPAHPIKIDGVIDPVEWDGARKILLNSAAQDAVSAGANYPGPDKFSGTYYYKWAENGLYIAGDVIDATPRMNDTGSEGPPNYWNGDSIEEFLSLDWTDPTHTTYLAGTDFHVYVGLGATPAWAIESVSNPYPTALDLGTPPSDSFAIKDKDNPKGYQFELVIPWQTLLAAEKNTTTKIAAGQKIGWFMFANNSNEVPSNQDNALDPVKRTGPSGDPSKWVTTVLEPGFTVTNPTP